MQKRYTLSVLNLLTVIAAIAVNVLANVLPLNGQTTGEIADKFNVYFKPAGYVFSIWGLIYIGLIIFAVYQILPAQRKTEFIGKIGPNFIVSNLANLCWLFAWHYEQFLLTVILMIVLLASLIRIFTNLNIGLSEVSAAQKWIVHAPFSLYTGWVCVAAIANITIFLASINWHGWGIPPVVWFVIVLAFGLEVAYFMVSRRNDIIFGLVILWAYIGIGVNNAPDPATGTISWMAALLALVVTVIGLFRLGRFAGR